MAHSPLLNARALRSSLAAVALGGAMFFAPPASARCHTKVYNLDYEGSFSFEFSTLTLFFQGDGRNPHVGNSDVDGATVLGPISPVCFELLEDSVTITAADGSTIDLESSGIECLDFSTGAPRIVGQGLTTITGGSGRFNHLDGDGTYSVDAAIVENDGGTATGTFVLHFTLNASK